MSDKPLRVPASIAGYMAEISSVLRLAPDTIDVTEKVFGGASKLLTGLEDPPEAAAVWDVEQLVSEVTVYLIWSTSGKAMTLVISDTTQMPKRVIQLVGELTVRNIPCKVQVNEEPEAPDDPTTH